MQQHKLQVGVRSEVAGWFTIKSNKRGILAHFPNLITDGGLDRMGNNADYLTWIQVGSGSTAPANSDTALASRVAGSSTNANLPVTGIQSTEPYYTWIQITKRFSPGVATGNLSEVGIGWATSGSLFSRALILDPLGDPTTITVAADETLDVTYELRFYPKTTDDAGEVTFTGNIGGTYDWTWRAANVTSSLASTGWIINSNGTSMGATIGSSQGRQWYNTAIAAITGQPSATEGNSTTNAATITAASYVNGTYQRSFTASAPLGNANFTTGITAGFFKLGIGAFQIGFDPAIPKTSNDILSIVIRHSWGRRP